MKNKEKRGIFVPLRTKLTFTLIAIFLIPTVLYPYLLAPELEKNFINQAEARAQSALRGIESDYRARVKTIENVTANLARDDELEYGYQAYLERPMRLGSLIAHLRKLRSVSDLDVLKLIDEKGEIVASGDESGDSGVFLTADPALVEALRGKKGFAIRTVRGRSGAAPAMLSYVPVEVKDRVAGESKTLALMGGFFIDDEYVARLRDLSQALIVFYEKGSKPVWSNAAEAGGKEELPENFLARLSAGDGATEELTLGGVRYLAGGVPLESARKGDHPAYFVVGISMEEVYRIIETLKRLIVYLSAGGFVLCLLLGFLWSGAITKPLNKLARLTRLIGGGALAPQIQVRSNDEIGLLGEAFNRMSSDLKDYHDRLARTERMAAWRDIARRIAHEIKNPLSPIQLAMENLRSFYASDRVRFDEVFDECSETILEEVQKIKNLTNEFSEFARMPKPKFESMDLCEVVEGVLQLYANSMTETRMTFRCEPEGPLTVRGDKNQLNRVFVNLFQNAVDALPESGGRIDIAARGENGKAIVWFTDNGRGMTAEEKEKVFTPYFTTKQKGSGLGMAMAQRIVYDHEGTISVSSEEGKGTRFEMEFNLM